MRNEKLLAAICSLFVSTLAYGGGEGHGGHGGVHWGYSGEQGPEHWGELAPEFATCGTGKKQAPINITGAVKKADLAPIEFHYATDVVEVLNNGHTVQANMQAGSFIVVDGTQFQLKQFHFHDPSENTVDGHHFPMEMHLVHADKDGHLAVVGVMIDKGTENGSLAQLWRHMPHQAGEHDTNMDAKVNPSSLLPSSQHYYRFDGSLTTPPCTEGVRWLVLKDAIQASEAQIKGFQEAMHEEDDARPVQPLGDRVIYSSN